jgi:hypothetical protein
MLRGVQAPRVHVWSPADHGTRGTRGQTVGHRFLHLKYPRLELGLPSPTPKLILFSRLFLG